MKFSVTDEVLDLGVKVVIVIIKDMKNIQENKEFSSYKNSIIDDMKKHLTQESIEDNKILKGFWKLHENIGKTSKKDISSPENLLNMIITNGTVPSINLIVDIYNLTSIQTNMALGAHDLNNITGNVTLRLTDGSENFLPIGYSKPKPVSRGEYAYIDDANDILCRMEVRQVEKTKVTTETTSCMYIVQGNENTTEKDVEVAANMLIELTTKYCGGIAEIIYK